jgi:hypothetical protein
MKNVISIPRNILKVTSLFYTGHYLHLDNLDVIFNIVFFVVFISYTCSSSSCFFCFLYIIIYTYNWIIYGQCKQYHKLRGVLRLYMLHNGQETLILCIFMEDDRRKNSRIMSFFLSLGRGQNY